MLKDIIMRCGPQASILENGAWTKLEEMLNAKHVTKILIVHGEVSWKKFAHKIPKMQSIEIFYEKFVGECTYDEANRLAEVAKSHGVDAIISVGGGKNNDCVKMAASVYNHIVGIMPTLAATCAAWTPVCVMYNEQGEMVDFPILDKATDILLVDFSVILDSPREYMIAGIGDTLAKWYESDVIIRQLETKNTAVQLAHYYAKLCRENILAFSVSAMQALDNQELNKAFCLIVETNIMVSGLVGGFGDEYARTAAAHSLHDALTLLAPTHTVLHGNKVAYGILVQLLLEDRGDEIEKLLPFYKKMSLPTMLAEINLKDVSDDDLYLVASRATIPEEDIHRLPYEITAETLITAIKRLETYNV